MDRTIPTFVLLHTPNACTERLGYLHCVGPHAARGAYDQHFLPRLDLSVDR